MNLQEYKITYPNGIEQTKVFIPKGVGFFTHDSPLGKAMKTGILKLPAHQGGDTEVKFALTGVDLQGKGEEG